MSLIDQPSTASRAGVPPAVLPPDRHLWLSARTDTALARVAADLADYLEKHPELCLDHVSFTLLAGREHFARRRVLRATTTAEAVATLRRPDAGRQATAAGRKTGVQVVFPDGRLYPGIAIGLFAAQPRFRLVMETYAAWLRDLLPVDPLEALWGDARAQGRPAAEIAAVRRPLTTALHLALWHTWTDMGYEGRELLCLGAGCWAAAAAAGLFSEQQALTLAHRMGTLEDDGAAHEDLVAGMGPLVPAPAALPLVSGHMGTLVTAAEAADPAFWVTGVGRAGHDPSPILHKPGCAVLVLGPASTLPGGMPDRDPPVAAALREADQPVEDHHHLMDTAAQLYLLGLEPTWKQLLAHIPHRRVALPGYPFETSRYWYTPGTPDPEPAARAAAPAPPPAMPATNPAPAPAAPDLAAAVAHLDEAAVDRLLALYAARQAPPVPPASTAPPVAAPPPVEAAHARPDLDTPYQAPADDLERDLAQLCARLLKIDRIGVTDNIILLGADSMFTMQLSRCLEQTYGVTLTPHHLFAQPTVASLAETVRKEHP